MNKQQMWQFITEHSAIFWVIFIIFLTIALRFLSILLFNHFIKKIDEPNSQRSETLEILKKISIGFIFVLGILFSSYAFFEEEMHETIGRNILTVIWMTFMAVSTIVGTALIRRYFIRKIEASSRRDKGDPTTYKFLSYFAVFAVYFIGIALAALAIPALRTMAQSALAGAGVLAVVAGVASQEALSNLVGGIFIVFSKPFRVGDCVRIGADVIGEVEDLTLRHTVIKDFHNKRIIIPNSIINKETVTNYNLGDQRTCEWIVVGISYDSEINAALKIMAEEAEKHPLCIDQRSNRDKKNEIPQIVTKVTSLDDSAVTLRAWVWARNYYDAVALRHDLYKSVKERFDEAGIEIPFPHRTIVLKNSAEIKEQLAIEE